MRIKQFDVPVYHGLLVVAQGKNFKKICKKLGVKWRDVELNPMAGAVMLSVEEEGIIDYFMIFRPDVDWREVAHESLHFVNQLFADRGVVLDPKNDEPQAYMLGWAVARCSETLNKVKKPLIVHNYEVK